MGELKAVAISGHSGRETSESSCSLETASATASVTVSATETAPVPAGRDRPGAAAVRAPRSRRLPLPPGVESFASVDQFVNEARPDRPVHVVRPQVIQAAAQWFIRHFPGAVLYAVKANPTPYVLRHLWASGIRHFDVASLAEVELVAGLLPRARMHFMHPVKSREAIRKSYFQHGVRDFVIDSVPELFKLLEETRSARDLGIVVRLAVGGRHAFHSLAGKFGAPPAQAAGLLVQARKLAPRCCGLSFHVGQQAMDPVAYVQALRLAGEVIAAAKVNPDILDVGGGFPVSFTGLVPPALSSYVDAIAQAAEALKLPKKTKLWCEPGRALVQESGSLVARVELRKENRLYINDGVYGGLFDAGISRLSYPVRLIRPEGPAPSARMARFALLGPTCDSIDALKTPVLLPQDVEEGDWIELGQTGGYSAALQSGFNGFGASSDPVEVAGAPMLSTPGFWQEDDSAPSLVGF